MITYLYHKQHNLTKLNYFGKTCNDPYTFYGSGTYWNAHLAKHGKDVVTVQVWEFSDLDECSKFATEFSIKHNIVESRNWANLRVENGLDGGHTPNAYTVEARQKKSDKLKGRIYSKETLTKMSLAKKGKQTGARNTMFGKEQTLKQKEIASNTLTHQMICPHCNKKFNLGNYAHWHGNNCKLKAP